MDAHAGVRVRIGLGGRRLQRGGGEPKGYSNLPGTLFECLWLDAQALDRQPYFVLLYIHLLTVLTGTLIWQARCTPARACRLARTRCGHL